MFDPTLGLNNPAFFREQYSLISSKKCVCVKEPWCTRAVMSKQCRSNNHLITATCYGDQ